MRTSEISNNTEGYRLRASAHNNLLYLKATACPYSANVYVYVLLRFKPYRAGANTGEPEFSSCAKELWLFSYGQNLAIRLLKLPRLLSVSFGALGRISTGSRSALSILSRFGVTGGPGFAGRTVSSVGGSRCFFDV